jgi:hypothetical protein
MNADSQGPEDREGCKKSGPKQPISPATFLPHSRSKTIIITVLTLHRVTMTWGGFRWTTNTGHPPSVERHYSRRKRQMRKHRRQDNNWPVYQQAASGVDYRPRVFFSVKDRILISRHGSGRARFPLHESQCFWPALDSWNDRPFLEWAGTQTTPPGIDCLGQDPCDENRFLG